MLHVTRNLPPLQGGMERLNARIAMALAEGHRVGVVGPEGCASRLPGHIEALEVPLKPLPVFLVRAAWMAWRWAARHRPGIVLAGSGLTAPLAWLAAPRGSLRVAYAHGLDLVVDSRIYRWLWLPFVRRMDLLLVNSANTGRLAESAGVPAARIRILHPGTTLPAADPGAGIAFREEFALGDRPLLLSVGRLTPRKGLRDFVEHALPTLCRRHPDIQLLVIGGDAADALKAAPGSERERILAAAERAGVAQALRFLPPCDDRMLSAAYEACDLHVFPIRTMPGDVEGFGMVAVEAAAHGLPTIAFHSGGVPDAVVEGVTGELVAEGDHAALAASVLAWLAKGRDPAFRSECRREAARWSWDTFNQRLLQLLAEASKNGPTP